MENAMPVRWKLTGVRVISNAHTHSPHGQRIFGARIHVAWASARAN